MTMSKREVSRSPNLHDVAALAGVSVMTVSRVLSGQTVRQDNDKKVRQAIDQLGYRRNSVARALKGGRSSAIGVVIAGSQLFELPNVLLGIETAAKAAGYWVNLASWQGGDAADLAESLNRLTDQSVEAIALIADRPVAAEALARVVAKVPVAVVMSGNVEGTDLGFVELDQEMGARLAVEHLLGLGHHSVVHLTGALRAYDARARVQGWRSSLRSAGISDPEELEGDFTAESGYRLAHNLIRRRRNMPTAIFAGNDQMAMGVLAAFAEKGIKVPTDVSLVGFDDIAGAGFLVPALTTVRQDFVRLGATSIEILLRLLDGEGGITEKISPALVVRKSTAPPPGAVRSG